MTKIYVSVINFNGASFTRECLQSLEKLQRKNIELCVVVVDNASEEPFSITSKDTAFSLIVLKNDENLGFAGGHNVGIKYALENSADYILILNNDTIVDKQLLVELLQTAESNHKIGITVPKIYFAKGYEFHKDRYHKDDLGKVIWYAGGFMDWRNVIGKNRGVDELDLGQYDTAEETELITGCCMLVKKSVFDKVGLFDEKYFLYYEDTDFNTRVKRAGFKIFYQPKGFLWHKNAGSVGGVGSELQDYFISRNRLLFGLRYAPIRTRFALLHESLRLLRIGRERQKNGVRDFYLRRFGMGSYNL